MFLIDNIKRGTTRIVFIFGGYVIKLPRIYKWKCFLRGILANLDENLWYRHSPNEWKTKMCPVIGIYLKGLLLISKRATPISEEEFNNIKPSDFYPIPMDYKQTNFGWYNNQIVLIDYADSKYFCSDCENILKRLSNV